MDTRPDVTSNLRKWQRGRTRIELKKEKSAIDPNPDESPGVVLDAVILFIRDLRRPVRKSIL